MQSGTVNVLRCSMLARWAQAKRSPPQA